MDCSLPGSSVHGIFQARVLEWGAIAFSAQLLGVIIITRTTYPLIGPLTPKDQVKRLVLAATATLTQ